VVAVVVCFEGIDGSGKTTQLQRVAERLEADGCTIATLRAVTRDSPFFSYLEDIIDVIDRETFCNIVAFNRYLEIERIVSQRRNDFDVLLFDRYLLTDFAYTRGFECSTKFVEVLLKRAISPDLVVLSDVSIELAMERIGKRVSVLEFQENSKVLSRAAYHYRNERVDGWPTLVVDGSRDMGGVTELIYAKILELLGRTK
jgi:dTMP kinase